MGYRFDEFYCHQCDFSIRTENSYYYRLMSGYYLTVLCTKCNSIHRVSPPMFDCHDVEDYIHFLRMLDQKSRYSRCPKCGARERMRIWEPADGCPVCGRKMEKRFIGLMVD